MGQFRHIIIFAFAVCATPLVTGCMPTTPETKLSWGVNDRLGQRSAAPKKATVARTYTYDDTNGSTKPTPRPAPHYVTKDVGPYAPTTKTVTAQPLAPVGGAPAFAWPVSGRVLSDFGGTTSGGKNDGINIATTLGAPIHASASGTVTYAGDELKAYGNLVLIKHAGNYTTAYAHAERLVVSRGDFVARGQVIGYTGQTGDVTSPQLHFEIRSNTTPVNPRSYLTTTSARN